MENLVNQRHRRPSVDREKALAIRADFKNGTKKWRALCDRYDITAPVLSMILKGTHKSLRGLE